MSARPGTRDDGDRGAVPLPPSEPTPVTEGFALSDKSSRPRPEWVKFNFHDLTASLKWRRMTLAQRGAYITLLAEQALYDRLPTHPEDLACVLGSTGSNVTEEAALEALDQRLLDCFEERDGRLVNPRMAQELDGYSESRSSLSAARSEAGRKGGKQTQANRSKSQASRSNGKLDREREGDRESASPKQREGRADALLTALAEQDLPPWVGPVLSEYEQHRREIKAKKLTVGGWRQKVKAAVVHGEAPMRAALALSVSNGWTGLFPEKCADATSQTPSRGRYYKGPPVKQAELALTENEIRLDMVNIVGDFMLGDDAAQEMARERRHPKRLMLDWKLGLRDAPPEGEA